MIQDNAPLPTEVKTGASMALDEEGRIKMGISSDECDNGKVRFFLK